jgi:hypothetical protein
MHNRALPPRMMSVRSFPSRVHPTPSIRILQFRTCYTAPRALSPEARTDPTLFGWLLKESLLRGRASLMRIVAYDPQFSETWSST